MKAGRLNDTLLKRKTDLTAALKLQGKFDAFFSVLSAFSAIFSVKTYFGFSETAAASVEHRLRPRKGRKRIAAGTKRHR